MRRRLYRCWQIAWRGGAILLGGRLMRLGGRVTGYGAALIIHATRGTLIDG